MDGIVQIMQCLIGQLSQLWIEGQGRKKEITQKTKPTAHNFETELCVYGRTN